MSLRICLLVLLSTAYFNHVSAQRKQPAGIKAIPDLEIYDLKGKHTTLKRLGQNKVLIIDNWFIPCPPCFAELGYLHKLHAKYKNNTQVQLITICRTDSGIVKKFLAGDAHIKGFIDWYQQRSGRKDFLLPVYFIPGCNQKVGVYAKAGESYNKKLCPDAQFSFRGYPTLMIYNKQGKLIFKETGFEKEQEQAYAMRVEGALRKALQAK
ncbi:hypothetical protein GCM10027037_18180 [Mucilaginibacter koreensis]